MLYMFVFNLHIYFNYLVDFSLNNYMYFRGNIIIKILRLS